MPEVGFSVEVDPEFPADGGETPERFPADLPRIGAVLRLTAPGAAPWDIAIGVPNWWRTPFPTAVAFISDLTGYVVDVVERRVIAETLPVTRIWPAPESGLLLMVSFSDITAIGPDGQAWRTERLAWDDLKVIASDRTQITCRGVVDVADLEKGLLREITIDPSTGMQLSGPVFTDPFSRRRRKRGPR